MKVIIKNLQGSSQLKNGVAVLTEKKLGSVSMFNGACLFACLPVHLSVCMYVCLSVCLFVLNFLFFGESLPTFVETALERCLSLSNEATTWEFEDF